MAKESDCKASSNAYGHSFANTDCNSCSYSDCFADSNPDTHSYPNTYSRTNRPVIANYLR